MKNKFTSIILIIMASGIYSQTKAQDVSTNRTSLSAEMDPITFAFNGYGIHLRLQPAGNEHLNIGLGIYAMNMPKALVDFNKLNRDKDWGVRINNALGLFGEYHFAEVNHGWFVGSQIGVQEFKIENGNLAGQQKFTSILGMAFFGYTMKPFNNNFYIKPWAGIGYTSKISGDNFLESVEYDIAPITMFATLHVGYAFQPKKH